jgi:hypothetical protein
VSITPPGASGPSPDTLNANASSYKLAFDATVRLLSEQQEQMGALRTRAGVLFSAAAITASFFGPRAIGGGDVDPSSWVAIVALGLVAVATVLINWPLTTLVPGGDPSAIIAGYIETGQPLPIAGIHGDLALQLDHNRRQNRALLQNLSGFFAFAAVAFMVEIVAWVALASA